MRSRGVHRSGHDLCSIVTLVIEGGTMQSTMQDAPLLIRDIIRHGQWLYADKKIFTVSAEGVHEATFLEVSKRAERLANALVALGVSEGNRVATFMWNNQTHLEAYLAVPAMGAVLHTLNLRLFPEQLAYVINHAEDQVIIVRRLHGAGCWPGCATRSRRVKHIIVVAAPTTIGPGRDARLRGPAGRRGTRLRLARTRRAAGRGHVLHLGHDRQSQGRRLQPPLDLPAHTGHHVGQLPRDQRAGQVLSIVPMFHANAWGTPYGGLHDRRRPDHAPAVPPGRPARRPSSTGFRPTVSAGVPTIWSDLLRYAADQPGRHVVPADDHRRGRGRAPLS